MYKSRNIWEAYNGIVYDTQLLNFTTAFIAKSCGPGNTLRIGSSLFTWFREGAHSLTKHLLFQSLFSGCKVNETATILRAIPDAQNYKFVPNVPKFGENTPLSSF